MPSTITDAGNIDNELLIEGAANPHECHEYSHKIVWVQGPDYSATTGWSIAGDIPVGISISGTGVVNGTIAPFWLQPSATDNYPKETLLEDGSNWTNVGRFKPANYVFVFTVTWNYIDVTPLGVVIPQVATAVVEINVIKDYGLDLRYYMREYTKSGYFVSLGDGKTKYDYSNVEEFLNIAPGPFGYCPL